MKKTIAISAFLIGLMATPSLAQDSPSAIEQIIPSPQGITVWPQPTEADAVRMKLVGEQCKPWKELTQQYPRKDRAQLNREARITFMQSLDGRCLSWYDAHKLEVTKVETPAE